MNKASVTQGSRGGDGGGEACVASPEGPIPSPRLALEAPGGTGWSREGKGEIRKAQNWKGLAEHIHPIAERPTEAWRQRVRKSQDENPGLRLPPWALLTPYSESPPSGKTRRVKSEKVKVLVA